MRRARKQARRSASSKSARNGPQGVGGGDHRAPSTGHFGQILDCPIRPSVSPHARLTMVGAAPVERADLPAASFASNGAPHCDAVAEVHLHRDLPTIAASVRL